MLFIGKGSIDKHKLHESGSWGTDELLASVDTVGDGELVLHHVVAVDVSLKVVLDVNLVFGGHIGVRGCLVSDVNYIQVLEKPCWHAVGFHARGVDSVVLVPVSRGLLSVTISLDVSWGNVNQVLQATNDLNASVVSMSHVKFLATDNTSIDDVVSIVHDVLRHNVSDVVVVRFEEVLMNVRRGDCFQILKTNDGDNIDHIILKY